MSAAMSVAMSVATPAAMSLVISAVLSAVISAAHAQASDPLALVPQEQGETPAATGLRFELARDQFDRRQLAGARAATSPAWQNRAVLDFRREWSPDANWKLGFSDRVEQVFAPTGDETRNALREIYASRALGAGGFVDAGRINWRNGVATGFNPTDFLKRGALIARTTQSPQALRENRLGTAMLRVQAISSLGSAQAALIPELADQRSTSATSPAWDRTNGANAALVKFAPRVDERTSVDVLAYARAGERPKLGANVTRLVGDASVLYAEWAGGDTRPLAGPFEAPRNERWTHSWVAGGTWTSPVGVVLTLEHQYAGDALTPDRWRAWQQVMGTPLAAQLGALRGARAGAQAPLTRNAWFARAAWDDAFGVRGIDLAAITRINATDRSRLWQTEARWHIDDRHSLAAIVGGFSGAARSEYATTSTRRYAQLAWLAYF